MGIFDEIEWTRFPPKHSYNGMDAKFQPASVHFHGRRGGDVGKNTHTSSQFIEGLRLAYAKDKGKFLGGPPVQRQLDCTFDVVGYLKDLKEPEFHGWGHAVREFHGPQGEFRRGPKKSPIHYMNFYVADDGMVRLRYKHAATFPDEYFSPEGSSTDLTKGAQVFSVKASELPVHTPEFADFLDEDTWTHHGNVQRTILKIQRVAGPRYMSDAEVAEWKESRIRLVAASRGQWQPVALPLGLVGALVAGLEGVGAGWVGGSITSMDGGRIVSASGNQTRPLYIYMTFRRESAEVR